MLPYFQRDDATLYEGDCRDVLHHLATSSVDAVVTDPPYELGFMGRSWDRSGIANNVEMWAEVLRVLKPGGYLLSFGGTRTYHRMACAVEDAGFIIKNSLMWLTGQGFPKNLNVSQALKNGGIACNCAGSALPYDHENNGTPSPEYDLRSVPDGDVSPPLNSGAERREVLLQGVPQPSAPTKGSSPADDARSRQSRLEGRSDLLQEARELHGGALRSVAGMGEADGSPGRVHHGASAVHGADGGSPADAGGSGTPSGSQSGEQPTNEPRIMADQWQPQSGGTWPNCERCGKPIIPDGLGTALKPGHEPIILAQKPISEKNIAANVARWGVGALNIDACRVAAPDGVPQFVKRGEGVVNTFGGSLNGSNRTGVIDNQTGRWPANVILDEDAATELDAQTGTLTSGTGSIRRVTGTGYRPNALGAESRPAGTPCVEYGDSGGASRFFYVAKAARSERNEGLDGLQSPRAGAGRTNGGANTHPTVKPVDLMRWLVRLVTPPGGLVLDPFTGSGTTGVACSREGLRFVGIEREAEYCEIIARRLSQMTLPLGAA